MNKNNNSFIALLDVLKVKHTTYSGQFFNEHPDKNNLWGYAQMLSEYHIDNEGVRIQDKERFDLSRIPIPFIAQVNSNFVVVCQVRNDSVCFLWDGKEVSLPVTEFKEKWSGIILVAGKNDQSGEPGYRENRKKERIHMGKVVFFLILIFSVLACLFLSNHVYRQTGQMFLLGINLAGMMISFFLMSKQLFLHNSHADALCNLFNHSDCNSVLNSQAAKLWGMISWSEIGAGYFISNIILLLGFPRLIPYLSMINICALPYTFWSIWYQKYKAKQWCGLCLIIQLLLWAIFICNLCFNYITLPVFSLSAVLSIGIIYLLPLISVNFLLPLLAELQAKRKITYEFNSFKFNEEVFKSVLQKQPYHSVNVSDSRIIFGNPQAKTRITVFSNPHCNPCARMHKRIDALLESAGQDICVQYLFCSFSESLESSAKKLIAIYLNSSAAEAKTAFNEWFEKGRAHVSSYFEKYRQDTESPEVKEEYANHSAWNKQNRLKGTPTILVNGYLLPEIYIVEDLKYFIDLVVDD